MDLRHLRHFITLAETGSLHRAARQLRLRQPALSQSIRSLEADVGTSLVDRTPSGTRLTQAGEMFLNEAQNILSSLDRAVQIARQAGDGTAIPLRLGITCDIVTTRLTDALSRFRKISTSGQATVSDAPRPRHQWMLDNGLLDLALLPSTLTADVEHAEILWDEDVHLVLPTTHPLVADAIIDIRRLANVPLILDSSNDDDGIGHALLNASRIAGLTIGITSPVFFLETRLMLVAAGFGITALPALSSALAATPGIVGRPLSPPLKVTTVAAWPTSGLTPAAQRFLTIARSFKEIGTDDASSNPS